MRLVGAAEMRAIDRAAIEGLGVPSLQLMTRAGGAVVEAAAALAGHDGRFVVLTGGGNNGGDGWVAARLLRDAGRAVRVVAVVDPEALTGDAAAVSDRAIDGGVPWALFHPDVPLPAGPGDVVIDALLGTGLSRAPEGAFAQAIERVAVARAGGARVLAVDVPSGLSADTGRPLGACVVADATVTFAFQKRGLVLHPGPAHAGAVRVADIGIPPAAAARVAPTCELLDEAEVRDMVPPRDPSAHKGDAGRLLVVAGSPGRTGAAHLALLGALRGGAGLVTLAARPEVLGPALAGRPEAMSLALPGDGPLGPDDLGPLLAAARDADALVIGPGIPRGEATGALIMELLLVRRMPTVLDADALNALAESPSLLAGLATLPGPLVLTPHPGEMARLCGTTVAAVQEDRIDVATSRARAWRAVVVLKGARTVVADPDGLPALVPTGNAGMATGGTGDVLAGLCGALLAGGCPSADAARVAAWVHGAAGDLAAARFGQRGLVAGDLGEAIGQVWGEVGPVSAGARGAARPPRALVSRSAAATTRLGRRLGRLLRPGDVVALIGDLGAGKTQLTRGACQGAGVAPGDVSSPTFAIVQTYRGRLPVHHADLYRLGDVDELYATGFMDLLGGDGALLVEWADRIGGWLPPDHLVLRLSEVAGRPSWRRVVLEPAGERHTALARALAPARRDATKKKAGSKARAKPRPGRRAAR